jgi:PiT family inorganic phosphate transporter
MEIVFYLSSGLFLGWSLGANDAANVFGTAVGSGMIRFMTAATVCSLFVIFGATVSGAGAAQGLGSLGAVNALPGAFIVALSAAAAVRWMTKAGLPVSITQAIVGAILGWNLFSRSVTDMDLLLTIVGTWVACPILGAVFAALLYKVAAKLVYRSKVHLLRLDFYTRLGLILAGALGSYSLGANNIGNVMGVFIPSSGFSDINVADLFTFSAVQQLFLLGAVAIAVGVFTYSRGVMMTVGRRIMPLTPLGAWVVVVSHSIVLFLFSSTSLQDFLMRWGLPTIPLIPVSSSQAVVGAVLGLGLLKGMKSARQVQWKVLLHIASGWVSTPVAAAVICFVALFFMQNVFGEQVYRPVIHVLSPQAMERLESSGVDTSSLEDLTGVEIANSRDFRDVVALRRDLTEEEEKLVVSTAEIFPTFVDPSKIAELDPRYLSRERRNALERLSGSSFAHKWQLRDALAEQSEDWELKGEDASRAREKELREHLEYVYRIFQVGRSR